MRFGNTNGERTEAMTLEPVNLLLCSGGKINAAGAVDARSDDGELFGDRLVEIVEKSERGRFFSSTDNGFSESNTALTATSIHVGNHRVFGAGGDGTFANEGELFFCVSGEAIEGNNDRNTKEAHIFDLFFKIANAALEGIKVLFEQGFVERFAGDNFKLSRVHF